jgi:hypothetical protein
VVRPLGVLVAIVLAQAASAAAQAPPALAQLPCGILTPCPPPPAPPDDGQDIDGHTYAISLHLSRNVIHLGKDEDPIAVTGTYTIDGHPPDFSTVEILARDWPYTGDRLWYRNGTFDGRFVTELGSDINTEFYARTDVDPDPNTTRWVTSPLYKVIVYPEYLGFDAEVVKPYVVRMDFGYDFPDSFSFPMAGRKIHWYMIRGKRKRKKIRQIAHSRVRMQPGNILRGKVRARLPRGRYRFGVAFCVDVPVGVDIGVGEPVEAPCP